MRYISAYILTFAAIASTCSNISSQPAIKDNLPQKSRNVDSTASIHNTDKDNSWSPFRAKYAFDSFPTEIYTGKLAELDFSSVSPGMDESLRELIRDRMKGLAVNFGGKYTVIEKSYGALCSAIYLVDRKTGKIHSFPSSDGHWGYKYFPNSTLLLANASLVNDSLNKYLDQWGIVPEFYQWTGKGFKRLN